MMMINIEHLNLVGEITELIHNATCKECDGKGYFEYETGVTDGIYKEISKDVCIDCEGTGFKKEGEENE
jgi:DnaJ-class molecular chaperone